MTAMTDYLETGTLDFWFNNTAFAKPTGLEISWHTSSPGDAGDLINERAVTGGARQSVTFGNSSARTVSNAAEININPTVNGGLITHWAVHRSDLTQQMLCYAALDSAINVVPPAPIRIAAGAMTWSFPDTAAVLSDFLVNAWLSHVFGSTTATSPPNLWKGMHTDDPGAAGLANEFTTPDYARQPVSYTSASDAGDGLSIVQNSAGLNWTNINDTPIGWWSVWDALTSGNFLARFNQVDNTVAPGSNAIANALSLGIKVG